MSAMKTVQQRAEAIGRFIIAHVDAHADDIVKLTASKFDCTLQAVHNHMRRLVEEGAIVEEGKTRSKRYRLAPLVGWMRNYSMTSDLSESDVWSRDVAPALGAMPDNVRNIWHYGFTKMFNNAIDHSDGKTITVEFEKTAAYVEVRLSDDGVGIFRKIQQALNLLDARHAVPGTLVAMRLASHTARTTQKVFDSFTTGDDYGFTKTVVPVRLTQYGDDNLVSRSQAKRLLARVDRFKVVILDFTGVQTIGQGFADEVFRVFVNQHPEVVLQHIKANADVGRMIAHVMYGRPT